MTARRKDLDDAGRPLSIRPARLEDAEALAGVHIEAWRAAYAGLMPPDCLAALDPRERAQVWRERLSDPIASSRTLVAHRDELIGFSTFGPTRDEDPPTDSCAEIYAINIHPHAWSTGAGTALLHASVEELTPSYDVATLWVLRDNSRARQFYERHGLRPDGTSKLIEVGGVELEEVRYLVELS